MHQYPLFGVVRAECACCHVSYETTFTSASDQVVCKGCLRHQGDTVTKLSQRDHDHIGLWRSELGLEHERSQRRLEQQQVLIEGYRTEIERLQEAGEEMRATLRAELHRAPDEEVLQWFASQEVQEAFTQRDAAYRSRDRAYRALWAADRIHHHDRTHDDRCSCGHPAIDCRELRAIEDIGESLDLWERAQIERLERGQEHCLPYDHPQVAGVRGPSRRRAPA